MAGQQAFPVVEASTSRPAIPLLDGRYFWNYFNLSLTNENASSERGWTPPRQYLTAVGRNSRAAPASEASIADTGDHLDGWPVMRKNSIQLHLTDILALVCSTLRGLGNPRSQPGWQKILFSRTVHVPSKREMAKCVGRNQSES